MRKSKKRVKRRELPYTVAIEVSGEEIAAVIVEKKGEEIREVRGYRAVWLKDAPGLNSDEGVAELAEALRQFVALEKLAGGTVNIALSSEFCVTRVVAGETDRVMAELRSLRERSAHYLSLGAGPKEVSECVRSLDVKHCQAWLTVTNAETLSNVVQALQEAGLYARLVEHSMVAICRAVGRMGGDLTGPVIIIEPSDQGFDLGISCRGQLLFDYRPGGIHSKEHVAEIVERHLERIQRYSTRYFRFASGQIRKVYLVGHHEDAEFVRGKFAGSTRLSAEVLNPAQICPDWRYEEKLVANPDFLAPLGTALVEEGQVELPANERGFPNLLDVLRSRRRDPIWPGVRKHLWPVAAAAVVGALVYGGAMVKHAQAHGVEEEVSTAEAESAAASTMRIEMEYLTERGKYLKVLDQDLENPPLHELVAELVKTKPAGLFLDRIRLDSDRNLLIEGKAIQDDLVFAFESKLKSIALLKNVGIESTRRDTLPNSDSATAFQIKCKFAGSNG